MKIHTQAVQIDFSSLFNQHLEQAPREIKQAFLETLRFFREDQTHPTLRNHKLKRKYVGYRSIDVTGDWRAVFQEKIVKGQKVIIFQMLGTHKKLYH